MSESAAEASASYLNERLRQLNCRYAQGFAFGAAMVGAELGKKLAAQMGK